MNLHSMIGLVLGAALIASPAFAGRAFDDVDTNGDERVSKAEFRGNADRAGLYSNWDRNNDKRLDEKEFSKIGFGDSDFNNWDANSDGYLSDNEVYNGIYADYDENEDGHWDSGEWDDAGDNDWFDF